MDPVDLREKLKENRDAPVLILATIGTTMKGAVDDIDDINAAVKGYDSYIHLDAALFGGYLHVTDYAEDLYKIGKTGKRYDSIAVSCHKFFGFPRALLACLLPVKKTSSNFESCLRRCTTRLTLLMFPVQSVARAIR